MEWGLLIPLAGIALAAMAVYLKHRERMASKQNLSSSWRADYDKLSTEYQEFVLGVDARFEKLEGRMKLLESKLRQTGESEESQQVRPG